MCRIVIEQSEKVIDDKPAIFHSDVDDSAESSTDDEPAKQVPINYQSVLDSKGNPVPGLGGSSKGSKKLMKMVDKIAESKFFQAATENKYIKRAMQGMIETKYHPPPVCKCVRFRIFQYKLASEGRT